MKKTKTKTKTKAKTKAKVSHRAGDKVEKKERRKSALSPSMAPSRARKLMPKKSSKKLASHPPSGMNISGDRKRVLLVEDDEFVSKAYAHFISRAGYIVDVAMNVVEARKKMSAQRPNVILLDVIMPGINGFEYLEELKKNAKMRDIPVIMISNLCQESAISRCRKLGAVDYLIKSNFFMRDVIERIDRHAQMRVLPVRI